MPTTAHPEFVLTLDCVDQPGIVHAVTGFLVEQGGNIVESQQYGDAVEQRFFMRVHVAVARPSRRHGRGAARRLRAGRRALRDDLAPVGPRRPLPDADHGVEVRALPQRPAVPLEHRLAADRHPGDRVEPRRPRAAGALVRHPVRAPPGDRRHQARGRGAAAVAGARARRRPRRAGSLHAGAVRRGLHGARRTGRSTSTTRSCRASRARSPTTRRTIVA